MSNTVRFLIIGDLHGRIPRIHFNDFDAIIAPGDICGDDLRPYIKKWIKARTEVDDNISFEEFCTKEKQDKLEKISRDKGREVLSKLNSLGKPIFLVPGNWDQTSNTDGIGSNVGRIGEIDKNYWEEVKRGFENIIDVEYIKYDFEGLSIIGHGSVSAPEVLKKVKRENVDSEERYQREIKRYDYFKKKFSLLKELFQNSNLPIIHITHNVPYKTKLDKINAPGTYADKKHYGSVIARKLIDEFDPLLCVGGHIHEGFGKQKIGRTLCVNVGFGSDVNTLVEIDVEKRKVVNIEFKGESKV